MDTKLDRVVHWGGIVGALGGIVWIAALFLAAGQPNSTLSTYSPLMLGGLLAMGIGMLAGHTRLVRRTGIMGAMALVIAAFSLIFMVAMWFLIEANVFDVVYFAMGFMLVVVSFIILTLMGLTSGGISRPAMILMLAGLLTMPFMNIRTGNIWPGILFGLAWVWVGIDLLRAQIGAETPVHA